MWPFDASVKARIKVTPSGSQIGLVGGQLLCGICLIVGFTFLWYKHELAWFPFVCAAVLLFLVVKGWLMSYKDIDAAPQVPTDIVVKDGTTHLAVTTDSRFLGTQEGLAALESAFSMVRHRRLLPPPDGLVAPDGEPLPQLQAAASERVTAANDQTKDVSDFVLSRLERYGAAEPIPSEEEFEQYTLTGEPTGGVPDGNKPPDKQ